VLWWPDLLWGLNCVEIEREGLFVAEKMHKKKREMEEGEKMVNSQVIN
jgi:hypothetical protein